MDIYSSVAFVTSEEGETALQEEIKKLEGDTLEGVQYLLRSPNRNSNCDGDTLRIWGPVKWYGEFGEVRFFREFTREYSDNAYLSTITEGDYGPHVDSIGDYRDNAFEICTDTSFFYYEGGKPKTTALMAYDNR